jgi:hypothetical protein
MDAVRTVHEGYLAAVAPLGEGTLVRTPDWVQIDSPEAPTHHRNGVFHSALAPADLDARVRDVTRHYASLGLPLGWSAVHGAVRVRTVSGARARRRTSGRPGGRSASGPP